MCVKEPADWAGLLARQSQVSERARYLVDQLCASPQEGLTDTIRLALAMMAVQESERMRRQMQCDFEDLLDLAASQPAGESDQQTR